MKHCVCKGIYHFSVHVPDGPQRTLLTSLRCPVNLSVRGKTTMAARRRRVSNSLKPTILQSGICLKQLYCRKEEGNNKWLK